MSKKYYIKREYTNRGARKQNYLMITYYKDREHKIIHRENGPAILIVGYPKAQTWCIDGKFHREDGPAVTTIQGREEYWLHGQRIKDEEFIFNQCIRKHQ